MGWNDWPFWLKGGIIGTLMTSLYFLIEALVYGSLQIFPSTLSLILGFIVGLIMGFFYSKYQNQITIAIVLGVIAFMLNSIYFIFLTPLSHGSSLGWLLMDFLTLRNYNLYKFAELIMFIPAFGGILLFIPTIYWFILGLVIGKVYPLVRGKSYWIKGTIVGLWLFISVGLTGLLHSISAVNGFGLAGFEGWILAMFSPVFIPLGAIIGWVYGKIKS